jgi:transposase-like protein
LYFWQCKHYAGFSLRRHIIGLVKPHRIGYAVPVLFTHARRLRKPEDLMARIGKKDHAAILHMVDVENRKISEVAAEYGCSPANLYTLLGKLRRTAQAQDQSESTTPPGRDQAKIEPQEPRDAIPAPDLFAAAPESPQERPPTPAPAASPARAPATVTELPRKGPIAKGGGVGATLAKPGFGLTMRTADGDENVTPFRSLEDLLSAVKPILRASARSQDAVWFCIQKIDLSMLEFDAA